MGKRKKGAFSITGKGWRKDGTRKKRKVVPVEGVEFVYEDPGIRATSFMIKKNPKTNDPIDVSRELFEDQKLRRITKYLTLTFDDSKVSITDGGSSGGTWVESKKGPLTMDLPHMLKHGDRIVFGATEDLEIEDDPETVRVRVKFLTEIKPRTVDATTADTLPPYSARRPSLDGLWYEAPHESKDLKWPDVQSKVAALPLPAHMQRRSRAMSLCEAEAEPETPYTDLEPQVRIPWSRAFQLGHGLNAVTGEYTATSVFHDYGLLDKWNIRASSTKFQHLEWQTVKEFQDEFKVGATVNVLSSPVGISTSVTKLLSKTASTSTILVQYKHEATLTLDSFPPDPSLQDGMEKLSDTQFKATYGDYYIAGYDKAYSCCMIVECKTKEGSITESHQQEVMTAVGKYLKGEIKIGDTEKQATSFSLLSVFVDTEGCLDHISNQFLGLQDAPQKLSEVLKNTQPGVPRTAILKHYSTLPSLRHLNRRVNIPSLTFDRARVMRKNYAHLRDYCRPHPALKEFGKDLRDIDQVLQRFENLQKYLVQATKGSERAKEVDALSHDLLSQKKRADELIERYDFIRNIMNMPKTIISGSPPHCRWRCGKTGGTMEEHEPASEYMSEANKDGLDWMQTGGTTNDRGSTSRPVLDKSFGQSHEIFRVQWTTPQTSRGSIFLSSPRQNITFCTREDMPGPSPPPGDKRTSSFSRNPGQHRNETAERGTVQPNTFDLCLPNHKPAYVVGWSISCHWPGTGSTMPSMDVDHPSKYILSDRLTIPLDRSRSAQWQCTVFYVKQSEYNFPDLFNRRRESLQPDKKPNWFHRIFRSSK